MRPMMKMLACILANGDVPVLAIEISNCDVDLWIMWIRCNGEQKSMHRVCLDKIYCSCIHAEIQLGYLYMYKQRVNLIIPPPF